MGSWKGSLNASETNLNTLLVLIFCLIYVVSTNTYHICITGEVYVILFTKFLLRIIVFDEVLKLSLNCHAIRSNEIC